MTTGRVRARDARWSWLRIFYYEDCKDELILDGIWPAICRSAASPDAPDAFFKRDWIGGPNVLIGLKHEPTSAAERARACGQDIERYLGAHPSRRVLAPGEFESLAQPYGDWELHRGYSNMALRPDNSVSIEPWEPYSPIVDDPQLKHVLRAFLCETSPIVAEWLHAIRAGLHTRQQVALTVLVALSWLAEPQRLRGHMSFRSHAEGFFAGSAAGARMREVFAAHYERERGRMRAFVERTVDNLRASASLTAVDRYMRLVERTLFELSDGLGRKRYRAPNVSEMLDKLSLGDAAVSRRVMARYGALFAHLDAIPAFRAWQIAVSLTYAMLNQLGIRPLERFLACYLVTRTAEDIYGEKASDLADLIARTGDVTTVIGCAARASRGDRAVSQ